MSTSALIFLVTPRPLLSLFTRDAGVLDVGVTLLAVAAMFQVFDGLQVVATGTLRGVGDTRTPVVWNLVGHWLLGLPTAWTLCFVAGWGVIGLWLGLSVGPHRLRRRARRCVGSRRSRARTRGARLTRASDHPAARSL